MPGPGGSVKSFCLARLRRPGAPAYTSLGSKTRSIGAAESAVNRNADMPQPPDDDEEDGNRRRNNVLVFAVVVVLVVGGVWLVNKLVAMRDLQNCLDSGRTNCTPVVPAH
jgi:hypothetical protein